MFLQLTLASNFPH